MPSVEDFFDARIKPEPTEPNLSRFNSPDTLAGDTDDGSFFTAASVALSTPKSSPIRDIFSQLRDASGSTNTISDIASPFNSEKPSAFDEDVDTGYSSDRTDFQEDSQSPCIRKAATSRLRNTGALSHHFRESRTLNSHDLVRRKLFSMDRNKNTKLPVTRVKKSANALSLENLRNLERAPSHQWDSDERELLCVLNRWYCAADRFTELSVFATIWNSITGLGLRSHVIRNQFECHLRLYGGNAYPEYGRVFSTPFDDPQGRYTKIRALIEMKAKDLGLDLQRPVTDTKFVSGRAKFAKSPKTRSIYRSLVRRASQEAKRENAQASMQRDVSNTARSIMTTAMGIRPHINDDWEVITDIENSPKSNISSAKSATPTPTKPHLTFRVWDSSNRTKFIDGNFVAQTFVDWPRPFPPPIHLDDPSHAGRILTVLHLSKEGDTPVFISTASVSALLSSKEKVI